LRFCPLRCTSLQHLYVDWESSLDCNCSLAFKGAGRTHEEQHSSMQNQLSALCSSTTFMAPETWHAHSCLTSLTLQGPAFQGTEVLLEAATRTPSLAHLAVDLDRPSMCTVLEGLSRLQALTTLTLVARSVSAGPNIFDEQVMAAIGQLRSLQQLGVDLELLDGMDGDAGAAIPPSWSALCSLTTMDLAASGLLAEPPRLALPQLRSLATVSA
jgi:hypothetical protein